jgi:hypothetical protein
MNVPGSNRAAAFRIYITKIFRTGAAIYTAVVVARSTGPNRPNSEFRVLLRCFAATTWKLARTSLRTLARTDLAASPWQRPVSHFRPHPTVSTCRRELLRAWWRPIGLMVSFMIFTASVQIAVGMRVEPPQIPAHTNYARSVRQPFPFNTGLRFSREMAVATIGPFQMLRLLCVIDTNFTILRHFLLKLWRKEILR